MVDMTDMRLSLEEHGALEPDCSVIMCQGPPYCHLTDDDAFQAQKDGCVWCKRIYFHEDGTETVVEPTRA